MKKRIRCLIVEDEPLAARYLEARLKAVNCCDVEVVAFTDTVESTINWLSTNKDAIDLLFMDVQLGDGSSFEIFDHIHLHTPIIFTTSYDQYAIKAFDQNSLAYLLKPINTERLEVAMEKYLDLYIHKKANTPDTYEQIKPQGYQQRFLVRSGNLFVSVNAADIAFIHLQQKGYLFLNTRSNQQYLYDSTVDLLEKRLNPEQFFRINRQFIVNIDAIQQMHLHERGRLRIETNPPSREEMILSINKIGEFKRWLDR